MNKQSDQISNLQGKVDCVKSKLELLNNEAKNIKCINEKIKADEKFIEDNKKVIASKEKKIKHNHLKLALLFGGLAIYLLLMPSLLSIYDVLFYKVLLIACGICFTTVSVIDAIKLHKENVDANKLINYYNKEEMNLTKELVTLKKDLPQLNERYNVLLNTCKDLTEWLKEAEEVINELKIKYQNDVDLLINSTYGEEILNDNFKETKIRCIPRSRRVSNG